MFWIFSILFSFVLFSHLICKDMKALTSYFPLLFSSSFSPSQKVSFHDFLNSKVDRRKNNARKNQKRASSFWLKKDRYWMGRPTQNFFMHIKPFWQKIVPRHFWDCDHKDKNIAKHSPLLGPWKQSQQFPIWHPYSRKHAKSQN